MIHPIMSTFLTNNAHSRPIVWLHGYGSCADNMESVAVMLKDDQHPGLCLDAPYPCEDYPQGRQWFSLKQLPWGTTTVQHAWLSIDSLVKASACETYHRIRSLVPSGPLWLAGFSQGAMLAYEIGFSFPDISGVLGFSGAHYCSAPPVHRPKLFWAHCQDDSVVPYTWMVQTQDVWRKQSITAENCVTPHGGHTIAPEHLRRALAFVRTHDSI